jgi:hypothetical protein
MSDHPHALNEYTARRAGMQIGARSIGSWDGAISHHRSSMRRAARMPGISIGYIYAR